jgi:hypothetical protein
MYSIDQGWDAAADKYEWACSCGWSHIVTRYAAETNDAALAHGACQAHGHLRLHELAARGVDDGWSAES